MIYTSFSKKKLKGGGWGAIRTFSENNLSMHLTTWNMVFARHNDYNNMFKVIRRQ